jgi:hypothetical protein
MSTPSSSNPEHPLTSLVNLHLSWRDLPTPITVSEEQKVQIVGTLQLIHDHLVALQSSDNQHRDYVDTLQAQLE